MVDLPPTMLLASTYLIESSGELFLSDRLLRRRRSLYRMELGSTPTSWSKVDGVCDDKVFLLGGDRLGLSNFDASCSASTSGGNSVYVLNLTSRRSCHMLHAGSW
uniref:DUF295 domain-containing protein n=1 Tax=Oryza meridionalis TaxID=40149 RepID=A0A0E0E388_9ORYZ